MTVIGCQNIDNKRTKVYLDNEYSFVLYNAELRKYHISEGGEVEQSTIQQIDKMLTNRVRNRILYMLGNNDKSREDIRQKLIQSGYPEGIVDTVVEELVSYGYIDDERYVRNYINSVSSRKSRREILNYLSFHNVGRDVADRLMEEAGIDEEAAVIKTIAKKGYSIEEFKSLDYDTRSRIIQHLVRKGFSFDTINRLYS